MPCIYIYAFIFAVGSFASAYYWSSTEYNNNNAWKQNFDNGNQNNNNKNNTNRVRAVRGFKQNIFSHCRAYARQCLINLQKCNYHFSIHHKLKLNLSKFFKLILIAEKTNATQQMLWLLK
jgi:hypothetical protein